MIIQIVGIVCITIVALYGLYKYWEWCNPYVDEEVEHRSLYGSEEFGTRDRIIAHIYRYKRTYKNGTVKFVIVKNNN